MKIQTGKGTISLMTLIAIWSISLVVNLPGLAVSPVLGNLDKIFSHTTELEIQLLTILPNLLIIPFILLSGKLSESKNKTSIVVFALFVYLTSGILYLFANSMLQLIIISCLLGIGCGLLIPLAAGLLTDTFTGKYRMQQLGIKSGISNMSLVMATFLIGWMEGSNWHLPFLVYLLPAIPLLLSVFLKQEPQSVPVTATVTQPTTAITVPPGATIKGQFILRRILGITGLYFFITYGIVVISYYLPFLMQNYKMSSSSLGTVTSIFFLSVFLPGFVLPYIIKILKQQTSLVSILLMASGLILMVVAHNVTLMSVAAFCMGAGYGILQPVIYDKATETVLSENKATLALSFVLSVNYLAITLTPFIVDFFRDLFRSESNQFPFVLNFVFMLIFAVVVRVYRHSFTFKINEQYY